MLEVEVTEVVTREVRVTQLVDDGSQARIQELETALRDWLRASPTGLDSRVPDKLVRPYELARNQAVGVLARS